MNDWKILFDELPINIGSLTELRTESNLPTSSEIVKSFISEILSELINEIPDTELSYWSAKTDVTAINFHRKLKDKYEIN